MQGRLGAAGAGGDPEADDRGNVVSEARPAAALQVREVSTLHLCGSTGSSAGWARKSVTGSPSMGSAGPGRDQQPRYHVSELVFRDGFSVPCCFRQARAILGQGQDIVVRAIGSGSCMERVCQSVKVLGVAV